MTGSNQDAPSGVQTTGIQCARAQPLIHWNWKARGSETRANPRCGSVNIQANDERRSFNGSIQVTMHRSRTTVLEVVPQALATFHCLGTPTASLFVSTTSRAPPEAVLSELGVSRARPSVNGLRCPEASATSLPVTARVGTSTTDGRCWTSLALRREAMLEDGFEGVQSVVTDSTPTRTPTSEIFSFSRSIRPPSSPGTPSYRRM